MKKIYLKPQIEAVSMPMLLLADSPKMGFKEKPGSEEHEDDEVDSFDQLL